MSTADPENTAPDGGNDIYRKVAQDELAAILQQAEEAMDALQGGIGDGVVLAQLQRLLPIPGFPIGPEALSNLDEATVGTIVADTKTAVEKSLGDALIQSQLARLSGEQPQTTEVADGERVSAISQSRAVNYGHFLISTFFEKEAISQGLVCVEVVKCLEVNNSQLTLLNLSDLPSRITQIFRI